jgi:hypothetical protein
MDGPICEHMVTVATEEEEKKKRNAFASNAASL